MLLKISGTSPIPTSSLADVEKITPSYYGTVLKLQEIEYSGGKWHVSANAHDAMQSVGVKAIRFPGGTEALGDQADVGDPKYLAQVKAVIDYCKSYGLELHLTVNDQPYLDQGMSADERKELATFFEAVLAYAAKAEVKIASVHIGNELQNHWDAGGANATIINVMESYGKTSALIAGVLHESLEGAEIPLIANYNYGLAGVSATKAFLAAMDATVEGASLYIDGFDLHSPNVLETDWQSITSATNGRDFEDWLTFTYQPLYDHYGDLLPRMQVDAWGYPDLYAGKQTLDEGAGLVHAGLGVVLMHSFSLSGVESVTNWLAYGGSPSALTNSSTNALTAGGKVFSLMTSSLTWHWAVRSASGVDSDGNPIYSDFDSEADDAAISRVFAGVQDAVVFVISRSEEAQNIDLQIAGMAQDTEAFLGGIESAKFVIVGVDGDPTAYNSKVTTRVGTIDADALISAGQADLALGAYEIARVIVKPLGDFGSGRGDTMKGGADADVIHGLGGNDVMYGYAGNDLLAGGSGRDSLNGGGGNDRLYGGAGPDVLDGGTGIDRASYVFSFKGVTASLSDPNVNSGDALGDAYYSIEHLEGSQFDDVLIGNDGANLVLGDDGNDVLLGLGGNDTLNGGSGIDAVDYREADTGIVAKLNTGSATGEGSDVLVNIENILGSAYSDNLQGDSASNTLSGLGGADILIGNSGADILKGGGGNDRLDGGWRNDWLDGRTGNDTINGGAHVDLVDYSSAASKVNVNLSENLATGGLGTDTIYNVEQVIGSRYADNLVGSNGANYLKGAWGADTLEGGGGADELWLGPDNNNDVVVYRRQSDSTVSSYDEIYQFDTGEDHFDFTIFDADTGRAGQQELIWSASASPNAIWAEVSANGAWLYADTDGNAATVELAIYVDGVKDLTAEDLWL